MKSLEELKAIKAKMQDKVALRTAGGTTRIVVGMATCGIAAGARPVLNAFVEGVSEAGLGDSVVVTQTGCIGICQYEPVVEVCTEGAEKITYVKMTAERAKEVIEKHIKGGTPITEYTIGALKK
jgi:NADP-reducing hydrogenase subunit HndB